MRGSHFATAGPGRWDRRRRQTNRSLLARRLTSPSSVSLAVHTCPTINRRSPARRLSRLKASFRSKLGGVKTDGDAGDGPAPSYPPWILRGSDRRRILSRGYARRRHGMETGTIPVFGASLDRSFSFLFALAFDHGSGAGGTLARGRSVEIEPWMDAGDTRL
jgi:hypothetical protein